MKTFTLLLSLVILASCSATYKTGQTPDDLYYSKAKPVKYEENVRYDRTVSTYQESNIRMRINNPRWRNLDNDFDYDYNYSPYAYGFSYGYYFNPYYCHYPIFSDYVLNPSNPKISVVRKSNLGGYGNTVTNYTSTKMNSGNTTRVKRVYNYSNSNNNNNNRYNNQDAGSDTRTYAPANNNNSGGGSSNSGSSSGGNGGGTTVTRPGRGG